jgi:hypothetical protein
MGEPLPTIDLALVESTNDLVFQNRDLSTVTGTELVAQRLKVALQLFKGEWFLDAEAGVPYHQEIMKKGVPLAVVDSIIREKILAVADINRILTYTSEFDSASRTVTVAFTVDTVYGPVEYEGALI